MKDYDVLNELVPMTQELHRLIFDKGYEQGRSDALNQQPCEDAVNRDCDKCAYYDDGADHEHCDECFADEYEHPNFKPKAQHCEDCISRQAVDELSKELVHTTRDKADFLCNFWEGLQKLPPVIPKQNPCEDAISRADVKKYLSAPDANGDRVIYESDLDLLPSVTPKEKTGWWISFGKQDEIDGQIVQRFTCSKCGAISIFRMIDWKIINGDLCPNCGAKMIEPQESEVSE